MSFAPQGLGQQTGISQAYQSGDRGRIDQMNIALLGLGTGNNVQASNQNNNLGLYGSPSQNLLQSTSSVGYSGNVDQYQNQYITQLNNQNSHHSGAVASSAISYSSKNYNYGDYGNIGGQSSSQNVIPANNYSNQGYQRSYENMTPLSQASNQANFNQAITTAPLQQTATYSGHNIGVQQINLTNNTAQINLAGQFDREQKDKKERDQFIQQIRDSQQIKSKEQQEENDVARGQLLLMEEMKRKLQEQEKEKQRLKQQQEQEAVTQAQLKQYEELKRQTLREKEAKQKQQKEQELQQKKLQQQQQQQLLEEQEEKKKRSKKQDQQLQQQQQQQQIDLEEQKRQQREQEEIMQRQFEQQKQQEEYYQQQLEMQQNKIMEQNHLLEQMKQALSQNQQNTKQQSSSREPPSSVKRAHNHKTSSGHKDKSNINTVNQLDANLERRLEIIETSLNRVCNQHDALMPLLQLLETVPSLQRSEQQVKNLSKKYSDVEKRLKEIETSEKKDSQYQHIFSNIDRNFKNTANQISQLKKEISTLENNIQQVQSIPEAKLKEDTLHLYRQVDAKLDRNMRDVKNLLADFKNQVQLNMKRGEIVHSHSQERTIKPRQQQQDDGGEENGQSPVRIYNDLNNRIDSQLNTINGQLASHQRYLSTQSTSSKQQIDIDIANIYREIGMLRSEMELLINKARNEFIHEQLSNISNPTEIEKQLFVAGLEQNLFLQEIESFDQINYNRIFNELELLDDKLQLLNTDIVQMQDHNTMYNNVNQIHEVDSERAESTSQHLLIDQYRDQEGIGSSGGQNFKQNSNITNIDVVGYELKYIGDRIFSYKQQTHGTKKKYLCDSRRLEDRLQTLEYLSTKAEEEGTDNEVIQQICQIDKFKERVDSINNSIGNHVSSLNDKLKQVEDSFTKTKSTFKKAKGVFSSP